eukprot:CAMPEP_0113845452 /NCGR_PEP_ID=MMETSP0372-20130328/766_1 /TAXON_ID=340204 /ORGANISM="Lankesteria abbotti" /LENGTH=250 /DNA_ID=CAMNT_0000814499 /DNA_START=94 /DNA_END=846 /DNA_ORIENTATION=- /assembly_acc=CAM_ASM_000359
MTKVDFGDVKTVAGLVKLNEYLTHHSYISNENASQDDVSVFDALMCVPSASDHQAVNRWYRHIGTMSECEKKNLIQGRGVVLPVESKKVVTTEDDDDDFDPFAEETEQEKETKKQMAEKEKPKPKKQVIGKSTLVIEVKPNSTSTDLTEVEKLIRQIQINGLDWSTASKRLPIAFGLMKLQIGCTIVDDLVNTDTIIDQIETVGLNEEDSLKKIAIRDGEIEEDVAEDDEDEDNYLGLVQSAEIVSFNKL